MMVAPSNSQQRATMFAFLHEFAQVIPSADLHVLAWVSDERLKVVVGLDSWLGHTCQMHVAFAAGWNYSPRIMLQTVFKHAFDTNKRKLVLGIVNSNNEAALRYDRHLGFKELWRLPEMHNDGGDIVVMGMKREECRYLHDAKEEEHGDADISIG